MPLEYEKMRDALIAEGKSVEEAKKIAAILWWKRHPNYKNPFARSHSRDSSPKLAKPASPNSDDRFSEATEAAIKELETINPALGTYIKKLRSAKSIAQLKLIFKTGAHVQRPKAEIDVLCNVTLLRAAELDPTLDAEGFCRDLSSPTKISGLQNERDSTNSTKASSQQTPAPNSKIKKENLVIIRNSAIFAAAGAFGTSLGCGAPIFVCFILYFPMFIVAYLLGFPWIKKNSRNG